jgi:hypothetical protein
MRDSALLALKREIAPGNRSTGVVGRIFFQTHVAEVGRDSRGENSVGDKTKTNNLLAWINCIAGVDIQDRASIQTNPSPSWIKRTRPERERLPVAGAWEGGRGTDARGCAVRRLEALRAPAARGCVVRRLEALRAPADRGAACSGGSRLRSPAARGAACSGGSRRRCACVFGERGTVLRLGFGDDAWKNMA